MDLLRIGRSIFVGFGIALILSVILFDILYDTNKVLPAVISLYFVWLVVDGFWCYVYRVELENVIRRVWRVVYIASAISGMFYMIFLVGQILYDDTPILFSYIMAVSVASVVIVWVTFFVVGSLFILHMLEEKQNDLQSKE